LKRFIAWAAEDFDMPILKDFIEATPTAELEPITAEHVSPALLAERIKY